MAPTLIEAVQNRLSTDRFGRSIRGFEEVGSTNEIAAQWAAEGAPEGAVVLTDHQTTGRGRLGRTWSDEKGKNLLFSVVLRPELSADRLSLITVAAVLGVSEAVEQFVSPYEPAIKWPNDVLLEGRKTCGLLLESSLSTPTVDTVVVLGVGLNVNQDHFPEELADSATSLRLTIGRTVPRAPLFTRLLQSLEHRYTQTHESEAKAVCAAYQNRLTSVGETTTLRLTGTDQTVKGVVQGITSAGALQLKTDHGLRTVHAGEVTTQ